MTFSTLRALHAVIGAAIDDIERVYRERSPQGSPLEYPSLDEPITTLRSTCRKRSSPRHRRTMRPSFPPHARWRGDTATCIDIDVVPSIHSVLVGGAPARLGARRRRRRHRGPIDRRGRRAPARPRRRRGQGARRLDRRFRGHAPGQSLASRFHACRLTRRRSRLGGRTGGMHPLRVGTRVLARARLLRGLAAARWRSPPRSRFCRYRCRRASRVPPAFDPAQLEGRRLQEVSKCTPPPLRERLER